MKKRCSYLHVVHFIFFTIKKASLFSSSLTMTQLFCLTIAHPIRALATTGNKYILLLEYGA